MHKGSDKDERMCIWFLNILSEQRFRFSAVILAIPESMMFLEFSLKLFFYIL